MRRPILITLASGRQHWTIGNSPRDVRNALVRGEMIRAADGRPLRAEVMSSAAALDFGVEAWVNPRQIETIAAFPAA